MLTWGVLGVGRAGQARARALHQDPRAEPLYGWRGHPEMVGLRAVSDLSELLRRVDAVAICTPDNTHPTLVRQALAAGAHVLVEFPLAGSAEVAEDLMAQARLRQRVLHVEHIELLGGVARVLREACVGRTLRGGSVHFTGPHRRGTYGIASANVARLHRIVDALGLPDAVALSDRGPRHLKARLRYRDAVLKLDFRQDDDQPRNTRIHIELGTDQPGKKGHTVLEQHDHALTQDGRLLALPELPGLFAMDQLAATARILERDLNSKDAYVSDRRVLDVLSLVDALVRASPEGKWKTWAAVGPGSDTA